MKRRRFVQLAGAGAAATLAATAFLRRPEAPRPLPHRMLGRTGVSVPILGLGTAPAGSRPRHEAARFFGDCLDAGVTYVDTAPQFSGYGTAQSALGDVLKSRRREVFLVTKCWEPDGEKALQLLESSLRELQTDHADLVLAHSIGSDKMDPGTVLGPHGVMQALLKAQRDGLTRFIGISGHDRPQRFLEVLKHFEIQVLMNPVSYVARHIYDFEGTVWPEAHRRGVALVAMKVYGGGLARAGSRIPAGDVPDAFRYAQQLPNLTTAVIGMYDRKELDASLRLATSYAPLTEPELAALLARGKALAANWGMPYGPVS